jgi:pimeloyl-ACP methyl ester carboxylesterase
LSRGSYLLHYEVVGDGYPLFLLPGAAADGLFWWSAGYVELLSSSFRCVVVDPPGMGGSSTPSSSEAYGLEALSADVLALVDELGFERFAIWGDSAGGFLALRMSTTHADRVSALVTTGAWPIQPHVRERLHARVTGLAHDLRARGVQTVLAELAAAEGMEPPEWMAQLDPSREVVARMVDGVAAYARDDQLTPHHITVPTLLIVGELEDPDADAQAAVAAMPSAELLVLPHRGHIAAWVVCAEETVAAARVFLDRIIRAEQEAAVEPSRS